MESTCLGAQQTGKDVQSQDGEELVEAEDDVAILAVAQILFERDPKFVADAFHPLEERKKDWVVKGSKVSTGRRQETYERDSVVQGIQGLVALYFDATKTFKEQPECLERALDTWRKSQLGHLSTVLPTMFGA